MRPFLIENKITAEFTAGRTLFSELKNDVKILFSEWRILGKSGSSQRANRKN